VTGVISLSGDATIASNKIDAKKNDAIAPPISAVPSPFSRV
jgi:hypothetical protein